MTRKTGTTASPLTEERFGYPFGIDGLMTLKEASLHLSIARTALLELVKKGMIRMGRGPGDAKQRRYRFCKRSILNYCRSIEK